MIEFNYEGFKLICNATQENIRRYLSARIEELYGKDNVVATKDYIFARGECPVVLVAHMDTVHYSLPENIVYNATTKLINDKNGIGGDDRCGVYAIIAAMIHSKHKPYVLLTADEEGCNGSCRGAKVAATQLKDKIKDVNFLLEVDRHGHKEVVFYETTNPDFIKYICDFGFDKKEGMSSDIRWLSKEWGVASANISAGYSNEHRVCETVNVDHMMYTVNKVVEIVNMSPKSEYFTKDKPNVTSIVGVKVQK